MPISYVPKAALSALTAPPPAAPVVAQPLDPWLRLGELTRLFNVSRTKLYEGMGDGRFPKPDGKDGQALYWRTSTIAKWLAK